MTHRLATNYAKNYCNRTLIVKVIVENVVTCFFGTRCRIKQEFNRTTRSRERVSSFEIFKMADFMMSLITDVIVSGSTIRENHLDNAML